jgi:hypothetical protein
MLTWLSSLGAVVAAEAPDMLTFAVAIAYPVTDLVLVAIVVLLVVTRRVPPEVRREVTLPVRRPPASGAGRRPRRLQAGQRLPRPQRRRGGAAAPVPMPSGVRPGDPGRRPAGAAR